MEAARLSAFQITPFGIVIIGIYSFGIWLIAIVLGRAFATFRKRWWTLGPPMLAMMALPWADEAWIASRFQEACEGAGVKVYRQVEAAGFYDSTMRSGYSIIMENEFAFMEHPSNKKGKVDHIEIEYGEWVTKTMDQPSARYHFKHSYQPKPMRYWASMCELNFIRASPSPCGFVSLIPEALVARVRSILQKSTLRQVFYTIM